MTVVDRLSKFLIPTVAKFTAETVADLLMSNVVKRFGFPLTVVSDRDPRFISGLWRALMDQAGVVRNMSSAAHPQTDGITEQANRTVACMASYVANYPNSWASHIPSLEIA
jgi:transposase InsO family protein